MNNAVECVPLPTLVDLRMGETIIAGDCTGDGIPIFSADKSAAPWNHSTKVKVRNKRGTLVIGARGTIGYPRLPDYDEFGATQTTIVAVPKSREIDSAYLYYSLSVFDFARVTAQQAVPMLTVADLRKVTVPRFSVNSQKKIALILGSVDLAIEKTEALIEKYQQIKAGLMHDLFTRGIGADGQLRPPREQAPELYQQTPIGWIPKEWDRAPLRSKAKPGIPHLRTGPFGSSLKGEHWVEVGTPVITIGALGEGQFEKSELLFIGDFDAKRLFDFQMKLGDVVFSRVADVGRSVVIEEDQVGWIMSSNLMRISLDQDAAIPHFLQYQLSYDARLKKQIRCKVNSGGRDVANSEILNSLSFVWPAIGEQIEIVGIAKAISARINVEMGRLEKLQKQKAGLMHDLLTGKVRVKLNEPSPEMAGG